MSLVISKVFTYDTDAGNYIQAVEAADTAALEPATRQAINNFVIGCKQDGIWSAIKASCILSGARTLAGALIPLAGTAPTNFNFVSGDYNRKTGLVGDGSTKYLNSNRQNATDPQNSRHQAIFVSTGDSMATGVYIAGGGDGYTGMFSVASSNSLSGYISNGTYGITAASQGNTVGLKGVSRNTSSQASLRSGGIITSASITSNAENTNRTIAVFAQNIGSIGFYTNGRLAFYSIGESIDLALLDARVTALITAFGVAIP